MDFIQEFFTREDGNSPVFPPSHDASVQQNRHPLHLIARRVSVSSLSTTGMLSRISVSTAVPNYGIVDLSLADVCNHIDEHSSLRAAQIISTECYAVKAGAVMHRFIILELRRPGRKDVWLRLDRRREDKVSLIQFFAASGITRANDRAMLSADKVALVGDAFHENTQVFEIPPILGEFTRLLRIIQEEIVLYRIWPENCWFFCSLIQQHLEGAATGWFAIGSLKYANLARDIRARISVRVLAGRPPTCRPRTSDIHNSMYPVLARSSSPPSSSPSSPFALLPFDLLSEAPSPSPSVGTTIRIDNSSTKVSEVLEQISQNQLHDENLRNKAVEAWKLTSDIGGIDGDGTHDQKDIYERLALLLHNIGTTLRSVKTFPVILLGEAVRLQRIVSMKTPLGDQATLANMLRRLGFALGTNGHPDEACLVDEEALFICRENYRIRPSASCRALAQSLYNYGIHLAACKRYEEACIADAEAVGLYKILFERDPDKYGNRYADSLHNYGYHLGSMQHFEDARRSYEEAAALFRELYL